MIYTVLGKLTNRLDPPHTYLPWITVDGIHNVTSEKEIIKDLVEWTCKNHLNDDIVSLKVCKVPDN